MREWYTLIYGGIYETGFVDMDSVQNFVNQNRVTKGWVVGPDDPIFNHEDLLELTVRQTWGRKYVAVYLEESAGESYPPMATKLLGAEDLTTFIWENISEKLSDSVVIIPLTSLHKVQCAPTWQDNLPYRVSY